jgi:hypothetical protein
MKIRAYGFSVLPSPNVSPNDLLDGFSEIHGTRKKLAGKYRVFVFGKKIDSNGFYRAGLLSIRDEKIALEFVQEGGELIITPKKIDREQLDFNLVLFKIGKDGILRGIMTAYRGAISISLFQQRLFIANRKCLRKAVKEIIEHGKIKTSIKEYIESNQLEESFDFQRMISKGSFRQLLQRLDEIKHIDLSYDLIAYPNLQKDELLPSEIDVVHSRERIRLKGARHGAAISARIDHLLSRKAPKKAVITGIFNGLEDKIDYFDNPEILWQTDLDKAKEKLKIKLKDFSSNPLFDELSLKFANDPRF